ncbi:Secreted [Seminavis robusta]|uniref:Secreted n=1 Tax=Seminavis robusta TaxID=568900 RepID=A0A9N8ETL3_9STRA|nr:Secreted [Seminavis robusta]|eukprot:Sro2104_g314710.1 Secreted (656) ;mRNA; r:3107-5488
MKLCCIGLLVAATIHDTVAKKYYNHQIAKDRTGLLGPRSHHIYESQEDEEDDGNDVRKLRGYQVRRTEGETGLPSFPDDDEEPSGGNGEESFLQFYTAESLDFFKKGIDPESFEWVDPDAIVPGGVTCGFLKAPLGSLSDVTYPTVEVYVCMRFAVNQPAPKGNLFAHCGGPGSLSGCGAFAPLGYLGEDVANDYNIISIDQRGMGRSWPSFIHEECSLNTFERAENGTIIGTVKPPEFDAFEGAEFTEENIKAALPPYRRTVRDCWTCTRCDFQLNATQADGNVTNFHFLEYSGTKQLAEDIFRIRLLLNAPLMHMYGVSYGTGVFSTYATVFPGSTGLLVLDSNVSPNPDFYHNARTQAIGINERIDYIIFSCTARNVVNPGSCPVEDMRQCIGDINRLLEDKYDSTPGGQGAEDLQNLVRILLGNVGRAEEICNAAANGDTDLILEIEDQLTPEVNVDEQLTKQEADFNPAAFPTFPDLFGFVYGNPDYTIIDAGLQVSIAMVRGQDRAGAIYDDDRLAKEAIEINERYTGAGTGVPGQVFLGEYLTGYYWPKAVPLPPAGNTFATGILVGQLYDSATPYTWTQEMKMAFPNTHLLTSQSLFHGLGDADPDCQRHVKEYFRVGYPVFTDGEVCGADFANQDALANVFRTPEL